MGLVSDLRSQFARVDEETRKAARYLTVSRAILRVPDFARRLADSDVGEAAETKRQGMHMAFVVTLAATYEKKPKVITIPNVIAALKNPQTQFALAKDNGVARAEVEQAVRRIVRTYTRITHLPIHKSLKALRDKVVAHHSADNSSQGATMGPLNRLMVRTVVLVDQIAMLLDGEPTGTQALIRDLLMQAQALWSKGIDAAP